MDATPRHGTFLLTAPHGTVVECTVADTADFLETARRTRFPHRRLNPSWPHPPVSDHQGRTRGVSDVELCEQESWPEALPHAAVPGPLVSPVLDWFPPTEALLFPRQWATCADALTLEGAASDRGAATTSASFGPSASPTAHDWAWLITQGPCRLRNLTVTNAPWLDDGRLRAFFDETTAAATLRHLSLDRCSAITSASSDLITRCSKLESLVLAGTGVGDPALVAIAPKCPHLSSLDVRKTMVDHTGFECLPVCPLLATLHCGALSKTSLQHITRVRGLRHFTFVSMPSLGDATVAAAVRQLRCLEELSVSGSVGDSTATALAVLHLRERTLKRVVFRSAELSDAGCNTLAPAAAAGVSIELDDCGFVSIRGFERLRQDDLTPCD